MHANNNHIKLTFLGDIMCDNDMSKELYKYYDAKTQKYEFSSVFYHVKDFLADSDYVMGNLETPIAENGTLTNKQWEFCTDYEFAKALYDVGVNYVATANNHCLDRGLSGMKETIACLDKIGLAHSGTYASVEKRKPLIVNIDGLSIALMSYTYGTNAFSNKNYLGIHSRKLVDLTQEQEGFGERVNPLRKICSGKHYGLFARITRKLSMLFFPYNFGKQWYEKRSFNWYRQFLLSKDISRINRMGVDRKIMYLHIGGQYNKLPNKYTLYLTKWLEKRGVDFIIANHEHVIHGSTVNENHFTAYALGNFLSSAGTLHEPWDRRCNYSIAVHVYVNKESKELEEITFSVLTTVYTGMGKFEVWPVFNLLEVLPENQSKQVLADALKCVYDFSGLKMNTLPREIYIKQNGLH